MLVFEVNGEFPNPLHTLAYHYDPAFSELRIHAMLVFVRYQNVILIFLPT